MQQDFEKIHQAYNQFERFLLSKGQLVGMDTEIGYWAVSHCKDVFDFFQKIKLEKYQNFIDLGSGDGRVVLIASLFGLNAVGIEYHSWLIDASLRLKQKLNLPQFSRVTFLKDNFMHHSIGEHDLVYLHPDKPFYRDGLGTKIHRELKGSLVVYGYEFHPKVLSKKHEFLINGQKFSVYDREKK